VQGSHVALERPAIPDEAERHSVRPFNRRHCDAARLLNPLRTNGVSHDNDTRAENDAKKNQAGVAVYDSGRDEHSLRRLSLMMELRQAIAGDELELYYQPKIDIAPRASCMPKRWSGGTIPKMA